MARYTFDTSLGVTGSSPTQSYAYGGAAYGAASPALSTTVTVNGFTQALRGGSYPGLIYDYPGHIYGYNDGGLSEQYHIAQFETLTGIVFTDNNTTNHIANFDASLPASITTPFSHDVTSNDTTYYGRFQFYTRDYNTGTVVENTYGEVNLSNLTVELASAVPEPSTWAMMILGFAGVGFAAYRRKNKVGPSAA
jgi:hypothetical protein